MTISNILHHVRSQTWIGTFTSISDIWRSPWLTSIVIRSQLKAPDLLQVSIMWSYPQTMDMIYYLRKVFHEKGTLIPKSIISSTQQIKCAHWSHPQLIPASNLSHSNGTNLPHANVTNCTWFYFLSVSKILMSSFSLPNILTTSHLDYD